jgi:hypothetical protein
MRAEPVETLILLAPIHDGARDGLEHALAAIADNPAGNPHIRLTESPSTHFARWVILEHEDHGPRLLFNANYDGGIAAYLEELVAAGPGMDAVWGACEGYESPERFIDFVRLHYLRPRGVYDAFPRLSVRDIRDRIDIRREIEDALDLPQVAGRVEAGELRALLERIGRLPPSRTPATSIAAAVDEISANVVQGVRARGRALFLEAARRYAEYGQAKQFPLVHEDPTSELPSGRERAIQAVALGEGAIQNQMTTVTEVIPRRLLRLQIALSGTRALARVGWPPGEFADVGTLHWFGWALFDDRRHLLFMSVFDGSWQNYMQDFINKLIWALDALYGNTRDYPAAGMKDVTAFTDFILGHQHPPAAFYSAYPGETVGNLMRDRAIAAPLATRNREAPERWLLGL